AGGSELKKANAVYIAFAFCLFYCRLPTAYFFFRIPIFRATPMTTRLSALPLALIARARIEGQRTRVRGEAQLCSVAMILRCLTSPFFRATDLSISFSSLPW